MNNEVKGLGNSYTAMFWEYDSRIGRRWNLDPRPYIGISEYSAFNNSPISLSDPLGDTTINGQKYAANDMQHATYLASVTVTAKRKPERNFDEWYAVHKKTYGSRVEGYPAWQEEPGYHNGESRMDRLMRVMAYSSMQARREFALGGMNMYGGNGAAKALRGAALAAEEEATAASTTSSRAAVIESDPMIDAMSTPLTPALPSFAKFPKGFASVEQFAEACSELI
jgi:hypothetical protein